MFVAFSSYEKREARVAEGSARADRRGASERRNKALRGVRHHVSRAGGTIWPKDVVLPDEEIRLCGR